MHLPLKWWQWRGVPITLSNGKEHPSGNKSSLTFIDISPISIITFLKGMQEGYIIFFQTLISPICFLKKLKINMINQAIVIWLLFVTIIQYCSIFAWLSSFLWKSSGIFWNFLMGRNARNRETQKRTPPGGNKSSSTFIDNMFYGC